MAGSGLGWVALPLLATTAIELVTQPFLLLVAFTPGGWPGLLYAIPTFVQGAGFAIAGIAQIGYLQWRIPYDLRGRVLAVQILLFTLAAFPAPLAGAMLGQVLSPEFTVLVCAAGLTLTGIVAWRALPSTVSDAPPAEVTGR
ncbi:hypothetical protein ACFFMN_26445 [Planobispora siamensis]|uniref:Uncharacterized protein n=1 Tax=Planobispora siamensis TaxID=936338 RepID=A0A8J3SCF9_9ACTN|nr:hypothetical protein [Planobispora siamensis]GIH90794.1 hypothetical protein Psi01_14240 [Planobispora siamensis]